MRRPVALLAYGFLLLAAACGPSSSGNGDDTGGGDGGQTVDADPTAPDAPRVIDASSIDGSIAYPDAMPYDDGGSCTTWMCENPVVDGCMPGTADVCGNGTDEDCDGEVDEGCACQAGAVQSCFRGPPGRRGVGSCVDGMQTCVGSGEFTYWGPCTGGITPSADACDSQDNDCNGCADDNPACCVVELACPGPGDMPDGAPFDNYVIDGTMFFGGAVTSWAWDVTGGPCDQLLQSSVGSVTYTLSGQTTSTLTFRPTLSGDYTVHVVITAADGTVYECTFIVHIKGPGLRIEMCSDKTADTDIDLHVHRPGTTTPWFSTTTTSSSVNPDDCYYRNCKASSTTALANWGYANSPLPECQNGPDGTGWTTLGYCRNPRLDIDSIYDSGVPENVNIDVPANNGTYRVMAAYYSGSSTAGTLVAHPMVNDYCGGHLVGSYGAAPDVVTTFDHSGGWGGGDMWRVVDVTPQVATTDGDGDGFVDTTGCTLNPLHPPGMTTGYWVTDGDRTY
ncbi:MAG: hypothetical protein KC464_17125 [Myxococcales bacterium]|nr:hypothetical protein [Myxococcales bacterium]